MVLSRKHPRVIRYRSAEPVLIPVLPQERHGIVANVVFPTGIDRRDDIGSPIDSTSTMGWPTTALVWHASTYPITSRSLMSVSLEAKVEKMVIPIEV